MARLTWIVVCMLLFSGCSQYSLQSGAQKAAIYVPFAKGDEDGLFTQALIEILSKNGFTISSQAAHALEVQIIQTKIRPLGYTFGFDYQGQPTKALYPNEGRLERTCTVCIKDQQTHEVLAQSSPITAATDFDYQIADMPFSEVQMSLGQLNVKEEAAANAQEEIKKKLAHEVAVWYMFHAL